MANISENAFLVLRIMFEQNMGRQNQTTNMHLRELSGLDRRDYRQAENYLHENGFIDGIFAADDGLPRFITAAGVDYVTREMQFRIPLTLNTERILQTISNIEGNLRPGKGVDIDDIEKQLDLPHDEVKKAFQDLEDEGLVVCPVNNKSVLEWGALTSAEGRKALKRNFHLPQVPSTQIGAIFNAPVNAQNLAAAINSTIEQTVNQNEPSEILQGINETLKSLSDAVIPHLELEQQIAYLQAVSELKKELSKTDPDPATVPALIKVVAFADNFNGMIELGAKAFTLGTIVSPYVPILYEQIKNLFQVLGIPT